MRTQGRLDVYTIVDSGFRLDYVYTIVDKQWVQARLDVYTIEDKQWGHRVD